MNTCRIFNFCSLSNVSTPQVDSFDNILVVMKDLLHMDFYCITLLARNFFVTIYALGLGIMLCSTEAALEPDTRFVDMACTGQQPQHPSFYEFVEQALQLTCNDGAPLFNPMLPGFTHDTSVLSQIDDWAVSYNGAIFCAGLGSRKASMRTSQQCLKCVQYVATEILRICPYHAHVALKVVDCGLVYDITFKQMNDDDSCPAQPSAALVNDTLATPRQSRSLFKTRRCRMS